jgi:hypothetical protein
MKTTNTQFASIGDRAFGARRSVTIVLAPFALALAPLLIVACGFPRPQLLGSSDTPGDAGSMGNSSGSDGSGDTGGPSNPPDPGTTIHVSPTGDDANDGLLMPVKTLEHAIGLAAADPTLTGIVLAMGTYSAATGELFPYTVPANITIAGPAGGGALLVGDHTGPGMTVAAGALRDLDLQNFTTAITTTGAGSLKNIRVLTSATAVQAESAARLTVDNLSITGAAGACSTGIVLNGAAQFTATALTTRALGSSLRANDQSSVVLTGANATGSISCANDLFSVGSTGSFEMHDSLLDGGSSGIVFGSPMLMKPTSGVMTGVIVRNMDVQALGVENAAVRVIGGELSHTRETSFSVVGGSCSMTNVSLLGSGAAAYAQDGSLTMRGCTVSGNGVGIDLGIRAVGDLGTAASPGSNLFTNTTVGLLIEGGNGTAMVQAVGNTWKPGQGAGQDGRYPQGTVIPPGAVSCPGSTNFCMQVSDESLAL